jgi:hypothetical protein
MRRVRAFALMAILAIVPLCASAASYSWPKPDPVGEKIYHATQWADLMPFAIVVVGLSVAWALNRIRRKSRKLDPDHGEPHHC